MAVHRRKRPLIRTVEERDARLLVVATEGEKTEKIYFDSFHNTRVKILTIPSRDGKSAPNHVLDNIGHFKREHDLNDDDELWIVVDRDRWTEEMLSSVASSCVSKGVNFAVSNPCFELWLAIHTKDEISPPHTCEALEGHVRAYLGAYQKNHYDASRLIENLQSAIERAKHLDIVEGQRWPQQLGKHVYRIFEKFEIRPTTDTG